MSLLAPPPVFPGPARSSRQSPFQPGTLHAISCPPATSHESPPVVTQDLSNLRKALELERASSSVAPLTLPRSPVDPELAEVEAKEKEPLGGVLPGLHPEWGDAKQPAP